MYRRRFLQASLPALAVIGAGCSFQQEQTPSLSIVDIEIENLTSEDVTFAVSVFTDSETVFESRQLVGAKDAVVIEQPVGEPGDYSLEITTSEQTATQNLSLFAEKGDSCVLPVVRLETGGHLRIEGRGYSSCSS